MPLFSSCGCCCSLLQGCIVTGVYTGVVYLAAFIMELCLVLEGENWANLGRSRGSLPLPEYILVVLHFSVVGLAIIMLYALYQRRTGVLKAWVFIVALLLLPELGIILFLVMFYWDLTHVIGLTEMIFYFVRAPVNVICIISVHSLYSMWRDQSETQKSLNKLSSLQMMKETPSNPPSYKNAGYLGSVADLSISGMSLNQQNGDPYSYGKKYGTIPLSKSRLSGSMASLDVQKGGTLNRGYSAASQFSDYRNYYANSQAALDPYSGYRNWDPYLQVQLKDTRSEFNASIYPVHGNMGSMPALNHAKSEHTLLPNSGMMFSTVNPIGSVNYADYGGRSLDFLDPRQTSKSLLDPEYSTRYAYNRPLVHADYTTQSLDRRSRYFRRAQSLSIEPYSRVQSAAYRMNPYYGYPRHKDSKTSLGAESDDFRRYRDVAL